ncbi:MAG TPA: carboxypeptidase regulatory-like domain-containing protein [Thermoanaerobaculia bacterium]|nr:carboxypeptidase regulatory-like domain-containing protein [Thermoanaerobaculia bacterium]
MKRCPNPRFLAVIVAALCTLLFAVSGFAQFESGNIYGKVQAKDGSVLPGVTVTLTGVGAPKTTVTDAQGNFRFINLDPGAYALKAELAGYGSVTRTGIQVRVAQNADVTMTLNPSVAESITVTAEAPLLDVRKAGTGIDVSKVELQNVPSGRDPWVIMQQTPGVLMDRINVGGNESGQQSGYVSKGATSDQSAWNVDGVSITDVGALGSTPTYYDFDSFEEMQITTGGSDPRIMTPGVQMNFVTKRGTNDLKGNAHWFQENSSLQATPSIPSEAQSYLSAVNQIDKIEDRGIDLGGPIWRDKLWAWGSFSRNNVNLLTATFIGPQRAFDKTLLENENVKVNAQPLSSNSFVLTDMYGDKIKLGRNVTSTFQPAAGFNQSNVYRNESKGSLFNPTVWKAEDTQIFGSSLYLTGMYSEVQGGFHLVSDAGAGCTTLACTVSFPNGYYDNVTGAGYSRNYEAYESVRPSSQARIDGSKFFDLGSSNHELKFGFGYRHAGVNSLTAFPGNQFTVINPGGADGVDFYADDATNFHYKVNYQNAYVGDTILLGNLTVQAALRYDHQVGSVQPGALGANPTIPDYMPAVSWNSISGLKWNNVEPRLGLTYALGTQKKTLLRASYNRYVDQLGGSTVSKPSPGYYRYEYFYFTDLNGDKTAQRNEVDTATGPVVWNAIDPNNPAVPQIFYRWDKNISAPTTDEFILGFETELLTDFSVGVNGTYRNLKNFTWTVGEKTQGSGDLYSPADYQLASTPANCTPTSSVTCAPFTNGISVPYYVLKPGIPAPTFFVITNRPDYHQTYDSLDFFATKRLSNRWMLRGNFTLQNWKQHVGPNGFIDPSQLRGTYGCTSCSNSDVIIGSGTGSGAFGGVYINSKWAYNITGTYMIPVIETNFGVNLNGRQGYPVPYVIREVGAADGQGGGTSYVLAENDVTQFRNPNPIELDLRLAKDLRIWRGAGLTLSVDAFNILNRQTILQRNVTRLQLVNSNYITELQSPRVFRLGARINF